MEFSPKTSYRAPPSSGRIHPFPPTSCRSGRPALLWGNTCQRLQFSVALAAEDFSLPTLYSSRGLSSLSSASRGAQIARPPAGPARLPRALRSFAVAGCGRAGRGGGDGGGRGAGAGGERGTCAWLPPLSCRFGKDSVWQHRALSSAPDRAQKGQEAWLTSGGGLHPELKPVNPGHQSRMF
ncbi:interleukin-15 isoform X6 [Equus asinus]|uniref:interleukin-15 isoform X6 n=1 Tax=Equus asinus TaxID=9793 RepID=UPI0038F7BBBE